MSNDTSDEGKNRRETERHRTLRRARIILENRMSVFDCVVRNISSGGAMIQVADTMGIPSHFELAFGQDTHGPQCTVRWRFASALGVAFDDAWAGEHQVDAA